MNQLDQLIRELEGADYYAYQEEPETKYPLWFLGYGWPAIIFAMGLIATACAVWRHFA